MIIKLDDKSVKGMSLNDAVELMRGEPGTEITLTVLRKGSQKPLLVTLKRAVIKIKSVRSRMLEPGFGYVRISTFQARTAQEMRDAITALKGEAGGRLKGMVLDLRNNPGGILNSAVTVSDAFLEDGLVVYTEGRLPDSQLRFSATPGDLLDGAPLVVLVNDGSASASEIVAGALQDRRRAVIMGSQTFGKGSVQTVIPVGRHGALKLTTARYFTPSGRSIQAEGITPDIQLRGLRVESARDNGLSHVKESDLAHHLDRPGKKGGKDAAAKGKGRKGKKPALIERDFVLAEALNMLKGLNIVTGAPAARKGTSPETAGPKSTGPGPGAGRGPQGH